MDRPAHVVALILLAAGCGSAQDSEGLWLGSLDGPDIRLRLALTIFRSAGGLAGKLDSIDQGAMGTPLQKFTQHGAAVHFESKTFGAVYDGSLTADSRSLEGLWKQKQGSGSVVFRRTDRFRPQDPVKPYPYEVEDVTFENRRGGVRLAGTLTLPRTPRPAPAVLLISGSGPEDRDAATAGHRPFWILADFLTRRGIAVLRLDDRGVGGSSGRHDDAALDDLAGDALAAVDFLKRRSGIDARRIGLLGHSEGGLVAPLAAARTQDVAFLVLLAAPALPGAVLLEEQAYRLAVAMGMPDEMAARNRDLQRMVFDILRKERNDAAALRKIRERSSAMKTGLDRDRRRAMDSLISRLENELPRLTSPAFRAFLAYDPRPAAAKLKVPVLALYGSLDLQVPPAQNAQELERALTGEHKIVVLPGLNHQFQTAATGSPMEYAQIEESIAPEALRQVADWIIAMTNRPIP